MTTNSFQTKSIIAAVTTLMMVFLLCAQPAEARWEDRSDELPGMDNSLTPVLVTGAVVLTALIVLKMATGGEDKTDEPASPAETPAVNSDENASDDLSDSSGSILDKDEFNANLATIMQMSPATASANLPGIAPIIGFDCEQVVIGIGVVI